MHESVYSHASQVEKLDLVKLDKLMAFHVPSARLKTRQPYTKIDR